MATQVAHQLTVTAIADNLGVLLTRQQNVIDFASSCRNNVLWAEP